MEKFFKLQERGTTVRKEVVAGITTFLAMSYILAVNPGILGSIPGMPANSVFTATALAAAIGTLVMAFAANLPVALAPGMGLNAFFTYTVVFGMGYSWQTALTAVFLEGIVFIILSFFNVREAIVKAIPANLKKAVAVGIGLFIALIGLANAGVVSNETGTIIGFAALKGPALVAVIGLIITIALYALKVPGSILIGIVLTTVIGIPFGVTSVPEGFTPVSLPAAPLFCKFDFSSVLTIKFFTVFFTFFFVDVFDTVGTLVGVTAQAGLSDEEGNIPNVKQALLADAVGTVAGAALGTSTVTSFVESTAGVAAGGRTGLSSVVTALFFLLALFLAPLFLLVPGAATAPALIFVGFLMMKSVTGINFEDPTEGIPCFIAIIVMPFAYSIAEGIVWGVLAYVLVNAVTGKFKKISVITWILFVIFLLRFFLK
ncbi:NCS2 family permease [Treponema brennaborense]|uniref:Xanthine/uracil/vitamin C permease n=1 Tax=Treponema brennaborense (strain DSM 12168 / CIP 105900 / DD5/3) TaxID=906968 RepID=F4LMM0_TREBD|nr:NCS2 family permease [Treponema brennaborense]AEE16767.1 Xanthine/uracil/vitamin C permease [Treponema brennaborense DSM 12168]